MQVKVELDIYMPLSSGFYFRPDLETMIWVAFKYEHLSELCCKCGKIDHLMNTCEAKLPHPFHEDLGPGMKVNIVQRVGLEGQGAVHYGATIHSSMVPHVPSGPSKCQAAGSLLSPRDKGKQVLVQTTPLFKENSVSEPCKGVRLPMKVKYTAGSYANRSNPQPNFNLVPLTVDSPPVLKTNLTSSLP